MINFYVRLAVTSTIEEIVNIRTRALNGAQHSIWIGLILTCFIIASLPGEVSAAPPEPDAPQPTSFLRPAAPDGPLDKWRSSDSVLPLPNRDVDTSIHYDVNKTTPDTCLAQVDGSSETHPTVQEAIKAAEPGALVKVSGYCSGAWDHGEGFQSVYITKTLTLRGGYNSDFTTWDPDTYVSTLDAEGKGRVIYVTGKIATTIEDLTVTRGNAKGLGGDASDEDAGGGIYVNMADVTIQNCMIVDNSAGNKGWGGGIFLIDSRGILRNNTIIDNSAGYGGGGVELDISENVYLQNNLVTNNDSGTGGGIYFYNSSGAIDNNTVSENNADYGGGIDLDYSDDVQLEDNLIASNHGSLSGGGIYLYYSDARLDRNTMRGNNAGSGGAAVIQFSSSTWTNMLITDNKAKDRGSGLYISGGSPHFAHSTIARNAGGSGDGIAFTWLGGSDATFNNTIVTGHDTGIRVPGGNIATLNQTLWHNNTTNRRGSGTITTSGDLYGDPLFFDPDAGDYRIDTESPAFDAGIQTGIDHDIDGDPRDPRPLPNPPDIGADENPVLTVRRPIASTMTFGAAEAVIDFADPGSVSFVTVTMVLDYPVEQSSNRPVRRHYIIHADNDSPFNATLNFYYDQEDFDLSDVPDEQDLIAYREVDGEWIPYEETTVNVDNNILTVAGVTGFSRWALGAPGYEPSPTAVDLADFTATNVENGVRIEWETAMEIDNLGFNLYRADAPEGPYAKLNETIIPAQMLGQVMGSRYTWEDTTAAVDRVYYYRLEDLDTLGVSTFHGPVSNEPAATGGPNGPSSVALTDLAAAGSSIISPTTLLVAGLAAMGVQVTRWRDDR